MRNILNMKKTKNSSVQSQIKKELIRRIQSCPIGTRLPPDRVLAEEYGVAFLTINRVMQELAWDGYVKRRSRQGTFVASRERIVALDPHTGVRSQGSLVFAYPNFFSHATWIRLLKTEDSAVKRGMGLLEYRMNQSTSYDGVINMIQERKDISGIIIIPTSANPQRLTVLTSQLGVPVVFLSSDPSHLQHGLSMSVSLDWFAAGYLEARALLKEGHKRLAYIRNEPTSYSRKLLLNGIRQAITDYGLSLRNLVTIGKGIRPWGDSRSAAYQLTGQVLDRRGITGLIYDSIPGVMGGLLLLHEHGYKVPDDFSTVTVSSGNLEEDYLIPPITTVGSDPQEEIRQAFAFFDDPKSVTDNQFFIPPYVTIRKSIKTLS